ncbi:MAG: protein kinase [Archangium sp.]|nr:protein kinase [Archangium sp.]
MSDSPRTPTVLESQAATGDDSSALEPTSLPTRARSRYVFIAEHARGGLGRVWRVYDRELGRELALKESLTDDSAARKRFLHEALTTAKLEHPAIVPVHDAGVSDEGGALFYTMKLVSGSTLAEVIASTPELSARLALLPRVLAVAEAVGYAHSKGVLHRDLKPENVLVGKFGETVVIDWGLAKAVASPESGPVIDASLTRAGAVMGTPGYMPPEQAAGENVDARADVYALGACLASVVSGRKPSSMATPRSGEPGVQHFALEETRGVPRDLLAIIKKAMSASRAERYADAKSLAEDLNRYLARQPVGAHEYSLAERIARWVQKNRALALATVTVLVLSALGATFATFREAGLRREAETSTRSLLEVQGRSELAAGRPRRAAVYFAEALKRAPGAAALRMLLEQSVRSLAARQFELTGMQRDVVTVDWSRDGKWLATGGDDEWTRVWNAETGVLLKALTQHARGLDDVTFSADSTLVVSCGGDHKVRVSSLAAQSEVAVFDDPNPYRCIFTPDGTRVVVGDQSGEVRVYDWKAGTKLHTLVQHTNRAQDLVFAPSGELVVVSWDRTASMWDGVEFKQVRLLRDFESEGASIAFSHDGKWAALAESDFSIHLYKLPAWEHAHRIRTPEESRFPGITFSLDDQQLFSRGAEGVVRAWHVSSGALLATIDVVPEGKLFASAMSPDAKRLLTAGLSGASAVWSLDGVLDYRVVPYPDETRPVVNPGEVSASGRFVLPDSSGQLTVLQGDGTVDARYAVGDWPGSVAVSEVNDTVLVSNERRGFNELKVRRLSDGSEVGVVSHPKMIINVAVSRDGSQYATACYDGQARLIDAKTAALVRTIPVAKDRLSALTFSPDGAELAVAEGNGVLHFMDAATGAEKRTLTASATWIDDVEYSPDGKRIVTAGRQDHRVRVWDVATLKLVFDFGDHANNVVRARFSSDGKRIVSVGVDDQALLYDATTGQLLRSWRGPSQTAEFFANDRELLTTGDNGYVVVWNLDADARSNAQLFDFVAQQAPWRIEAGRLVLTR